MREYLQSLWREPAVPDPPARVWRDWVLIGLLVPTALLEGIFAPDLVWRPFATMLAIALAPALLWRRTHPLASLLVVFGTFIVTDVARLIAGVDNIGLGTMAYALLFPYALVRWGSGRAIVVGIVPTMLAATMSVLFDTTTIGEAIGGFSVLGMAFASGGVVRYQRKEQAQALEEVRARERERLARDLHDTVAHHVSAIMIRAQAGLATAPARPGAATEALHVIEAEAGRTLAEMRTLVGLLRREDPAEMTPLPTIADLARLGDLPATAGEAPVRVHLDGDVGVVHPTVSTTVFRLAQESITNARRHARNAGCIDVSVRVADDRVHLAVRDDGEAIGAAPGPGFGLVGMIERAALLGGTCTAGPGAGRGWIVRADLPAQASPR